jgi:hypothetical protein
MAVALYEDLGTGQYRLDFIVTRVWPKPSSSTTSKGGTLRIYLQYTCGMGHMEPPTKNSWKTGGQINRIYTLSDIPAPPMRPFLPPTTPKLTHFTNVLAFGDSLMGQLVGNTYQGYTSVQVYHPNLRYADNIQQPLNSYTRNQWLLELRRHFGETLTWNATDTALLIGSSTWDLLLDTTSSTRSYSMDNYWKDHIRACRQLIQTIQLSYPNGTIFWKSPTAMHVHVVPTMVAYTSTQEETSMSRSIQERQNKTRYMSSSGASRLYELQMQIMNELGIEMLDLYEATYLLADWTLPDDGRHFKSDANRKMLNWFYNH